MSNAKQIERVLVVEDDAAISQLMAMSLELQGYQVSVAMNGVEAREQLHGDDGEGDWPVDAVLIDLFMPLMDGLALLKWVRAQSRPRLPVIVMTAMKSGRTMHEVDEAGADHVLFKPINMQRLLELLRGLQPTR